MGAENSDLHLTTQQKGLSGILNNNLELLIQFDQHLERYALTGLMIKLQIFRPYFSEIEGREITDEEKLKIEKWKPSIELLFKILGPDRILKAKEFYPGQMDVFSFFHKECNKKIIYGIDIVEWALKYTRDFEIDHNSCESDDDLDEFLKIAVNENQLEAIKFLNQSGGDPKLGFEFLTSSQVQALKLLGPNTANLMQFLILEEGEKNAYESLTHNILDVACVLSLFGVIFMYYICEYNSLTYSTPIKEITSVANQYFGIGFSAQEFKYIAECLGIVSIFPDAALDNIIQLLTSSLVAEKLAETAYTYSSDIYDIYSYVIGNGNEELLIPTSEEPLKVEV